MDSLFANYASSDDEVEDSRSQNLPSNPTKSIAGHRSNGDQEEPKPTNSHSKSPSSLFASLPQPKSASLFSSVPAPKSRKFLPAPRLSELNSPGPATKKVVQFRPPPIGLSKNSGNEDGDDDDEDDEDEDKKENQKTNSGTLTVKSLFSSMPAPKNSGSFGALPSASGTGRRSMLEAGVPATCDSSLVKTVNNEISSVAGDTHNQSSVDPNASLDYPGSSDYSNLASGYDINGSYQSDGTVDSNYGLGGGSGDYGTYEGGYSNNASYDGYVQSASNSADRSFTSIPHVDNSVRVPGKRGRKEVPTEIIEVNQDDLMKDRPREDKAKATGIAFGPSYQPVSAKGKPSKLLKRKHQIGSLYFDMKQNETMLQERRSKGLLTKAQTHAKYGWA